MVFIGLGNPGTRYSGTRHNAGFMVLDLLARELSLSFHKAWFHPLRIACGQYAGQSLYLIKPLTYMNRSGDIIPWVLKKTGASPERLVIIADHLDLPIGTLRLKKKGTSGGQRGIESLIQSLGSTAFNRLLLGIGRPETGNDVINHVLGVFPDSELPVFKEAVKAAAAACLRLLEEPVEKVMNDVNRRSTL